MDREDARRQTFERDKHRCVFCGEKALDAHHILERRLWEDGGYHLDNLISVCGPCHLACERTLLSVEDCREAADIRCVLVPAHLYADTRYDKWGNVLLDGGRILMGDLFDESVPHLRAANKMDRVVKYVKYPRTFHLPWSFPNRDDKVLQSLASFEGKEVVVTEKLDGECVTLYDDYMHARSLDGPHRNDQSWIRQFHAQRGWQIPSSMRVCGESLYARHSIEYHDLETYFYGFSMWDGLTCLSWDDTLEWFALLGIAPVPVLWEGVWDEKAIRRITVDEATQEGYVVRTRESFAYREFKTHVAKYVRQGHVQTHERWKRRIVPNQLRKEHE